MWALWVFLGIFGGHRFYLGHVGLGLLQLFTLGGFFIWWIIDAFIIQGTLTTQNRRLREQIFMRRGLSQAI